MLNRMSSEAPGGLDLRAARAFLALMAEGEPVTFQTFDDNKDRADGSLAEHFTAEFEDVENRLRRLNASGAGVYWMVNQGDGRGRSGKNVTGVRALFLDLDGAPLAPVLVGAPEPHAIVESSPGRWHIYWLVTHCALEQFTPAQASLAEKFDGDRKVKDLPRVMRLPGFEHRKGDPFVSRIVETHPMLPYDLNEFMDAVGIDLAASIRSPVVVVDDGATHVIAGGRNDYLSRRAFTLHRQGQSAQAIESELRAINIARCSPPLSEPEIHAIVMGKSSVERNPLAIETPSEAVVVPLLSIAALRAASQNLQWAVKHVVPADSVGVMFGASGTFKSFVALDLALHIAHGLRWLGRKTTAGPVIYIAAEGGAGIWRRVQAWHAGRGVEVVDTLPFHVVPVAVQLMSSASDVVLAASAVGVVPKMVIVDTMGQTFEGEENSSSDVGKYFRALGAWFRATWNCVVLVIHHTGHVATERPRGSSSITANTDFLFGVFRDEKDLICTVECVKQRDGEQFEPLMFDLTSQLLGHDEDGDPIRALSARHLLTANAMQAALEENKGRGRPPGSLSAFLGVVQTGMNYSAVRAAFYIELGEKTAEAKERAWFRSVSQAKTMGFVEIVNGEFLVISDTRSAD